MLNPDRLHLPPIMLKIQEYTVQIHLHSYCIRRKMPCTVSKKDSLSLQESCCSQTAPLTRFKLKGFTTTFSLGEGVSLSFIKKPRNSVGSGNEITLLQLQPTFVL